MKIPEPKDEAEAYFWTMKDHIRRVRRAATF